MRLLSFDALRTLDIPGVTTLKPELWLQHRDAIDRADWVLFPEYWQLNTLLYGFHKRVFPSPASYHLGHDKVEMTRVLEALYPAHVPTTLIRANTPANREEILDTFTFPFVVKSVRSSMGLGVMRIDHHAQLVRYAAENDVLYAQELLPIDRDLRIVVIGKQVVGAYWRVAAPGNWHNNVAQGGRVDYEHIPPAAINLVLKVASKLGIDHAGFDVAVCAGHYFFFEFNVRFGTQALTDRGLRWSETLLAHLRGDMA